MRLILVYFSLTDASMREQGESDQFNGRARKRKADSPSSSSNPEWFLDTNSADRNFIAGIDSILDTLAQELTVKLSRWPLGSVVQDLEGKISTLLEDIEAMKGIDYGDSDATIQTLREPYMESDHRWLEWVLLIEDTARLASAARFDQGKFLNDFYPFVRLHLAMVEWLFGIDDYLEDKDSELSVLKEVKDHFASGFATLYLPGGRTVTAADIDAVHDELCPRIEDVWLKLASGTLSNVGEARDLDILGNFERLVSQLTVEPSFPGSDWFKTLVCPKLSKLIAYASAVLSRTDPRRGNRLIFSVIHICDEEDIKLRHELIGLLPDVVVTETFLEKRILTLPAGKKDQWEFSLELLGNDDVVLLYDLVVRFENSPARGLEGPRAQWLSLLFENLFVPNEGIFEYSDETMQFLKPVAVADAKSLLVVGRVIGLAIRYGLTIGARLTPCVVALLRLPSTAFNLEKCVSVEDKQFVESLIKMESDFNSDPQEAAKVYSDNLTRESFPEYKRDKLYEKGIGRVRTAVVLIKRGIRSVTPSSVLELFTDKQFEEMMNGVVELSAETLWRGINYMPNPNLEYYAAWLKEILTDQTDKFRFAFNRFITGVAQPPAGARSPWIWVSFSDMPSKRTSLPSAVICSRSLILPIYSNKATLLSKLSTALYEGGNDSLELA